MIRILPCNYISHKELSEEASTETGVHPINYPYIIKFRNILKKLYEYKEIDYTNDKVRQTYFEAFHGRCAYTGIKLDINNFHMDHVFPQSLGGISSPINLVPTTSSVNIRKKNKFNVLCMEVLSELENGLLPILVEKLGYSVINKIPEYDRIFKKYHKCTKYIECIEENQGPYSSINTDYNISMKDSLEYYYSEIPELADISFLLYGFNDMPPTTILSVANISKYLNVSVNIINRGLGLLYGLGIVEPGIYKNSLAVYGTYSENDLFYFGEGLYEIQSYINQQYEIDSVGFDVWMKVLKETNTPICIQSSVITE